MVDDNFYTKLYYSRVSQKRFEQLQNNLVSFFKKMVKDDPLSEDYLKEKTEKIMNSKNEPGVFLSLIRMLNPGAIRIFASVIDDDLREYIRFRYESVNEKYNFFDQR